MNIEAWEKRWAKEWKDIGVFAHAYKKALRRRLKVAEARHEKLLDASLTYEEATEATQTPEEDERLNRLIDVASKARDAMERLEERIELIEQIVVLHGRTLGRR